MFQGRLITRKAAFQACLRLGGSPFRQCLSPVPYPLPAAAAHEVDAEEKAHVVKHIVHVVSFKAPSTVK